MAWLIALIGPALSGLWALKNRKELAHIFRIWQAIKGLLQALRNEPVSVEAAEKKERRKWFRFKRREAVNQVMEAGDKIEGTNDGL